MELIERKRKRRKPKEEKNEQDGSITHAGDDL